MRALELGRSERDRRQYNIILYYKKTYFYNNKLYSVILIILTVAIIIYFFFIIVNENKYSVRTEPIHRSGWLCILYMYSVYTV